MSFVDPEEMRGLTTQINERKHRVWLLRMAVIVSACLLGTSIVVGLSLALWSSTRGRVDSVQVGRDNAQRAQCDAQFSQASADAFRAYEADIGDLIVIISTIAPGDQRTSAAAEKVNALERDVQLYRSKSDLRSAYLDAGRPIPCPYVKDKP